MKARFGIAVVAAASLAAADLIVKAATHANPLWAHHRSPGWAAASLALLVVALMTTRLPSRLLALAAGVFVGGLAGNLASAALHGGVVPNPFVVGSVALNLADVSVLTGIMLGIVATMRLALRYRHLLPRQTIAVRLGRRLLRIVTDT